MIATILACILTLADPPAELVVVGMEGCGPCKALWATVEQIAPTKSKLPWRARYIDCDDDYYREWLTRSGIHGPYPYVLFYRQNRCLGYRIGGTGRQELLEWVGNLLRVSTDAHTTKPK